MSITIEPLARRALPSGEKAVPPSVKFTFGRRSLSATVVIDTLEAREMARILTAAANAAEAMEPVIASAENEPTRQPVPKWASEALADLVSKGELRQAEPVVDQTEDGGAR